MKERKKEWENKYIKLNIKSKGALDVHLTLISQYWREVSGGKAAVNNYRLACHVTGTLADQP